MSAAVNTPRIMVPRQTVENPGGQTEFRFEPGAYNGTIEEIRIREYPEWISSLAGDVRASRGYASAEGELLSVQLGSIRPLEGQTDPGNRKFFTQDYVIRDGEVTVTDPEVFHDAFLGWQLQRGATALVRLADALGHAEIIQGEDGQEYYTVTEDFIEALRGGEFNGSEVGFLVFNRPWKSKNTGKEGVEVGVQTWTPAV